MEENYTKEQLLKSYRNGQRRFEGLDMFHVDLQGENLEGIVFDKCFLMVDFRKCNLTNAKFINGNIKGSDFREANLTNALMERVAFEGTRFESAILDGFQFRENYFHGGSDFGQREFEEWIEDIKWVEREAFDLLIKFVGNQISLENLKEGVDVLGNKGAKSKAEINEYILDQAGFQFLESAHGMSAQERAFKKARYKFLRENLQ